MKVGIKKAPINKVSDWNEYNHWIKEKGIQGEFKGDLQRKKDLDGAICSAVNVKGQSSFEETEDGYDGWYKHHPWATEKAMIDIDDQLLLLLTGHHLISTSVTESLSKFFTNIIEQYIGYNVNSPNNLFILPNSTTISCYLGIPLHESGHTHKITDNKLINSVQRAMNSTVTTDSTVDKDEIEKIKEKNEKVPQVIKSVWEKPKDEETIMQLGYHAKVYKLVNPIIHKHFRCENNLDHNAFIQDMNKVSKKILKKLVKFQWDLHKTAQDYKPGSDEGCRNTQVIGRLAKGKPHSKESDKTLPKKNKKVKHAPCESGRKHPELEPYFLHKTAKKEFFEGGSNQRRREVGLKVASEVIWQ